MYQAIDELPVSPDDVAIAQYEYEDGVMIASRHRYAKVQCVCGCGRGGGGGMKVDARHWAVLPLETGGTVPVRGWGDDRKQAPLRKGAGGYLKVYAYMLTTG